MLDLIPQPRTHCREKAQRLRRRIIGAMICPIVVICIATLIVTGIMIWVIPKFQEIFNDFGVALQFGNYR